MAAGLVAVLGLFLLVDAAVRGSWIVVLDAVGPIAVLVWVLWVLTYRPCIRIDDTAVTVVNPLRRTVVPWHAVADVKLRWQIVIETVAGRRVQCWGGPSLPRPKPARRGERAVLRQPDEMTVLLDRWAEQRAVAGDGDAVRGWDRPAVIVGAVALALLAVSLLSLSLGV
ncbi:MULTISPECIES: PH domain-containing protein [unclassified Curtobacterium]|uniref:PH domain-containing protein n=1 Tax=unclassified Curtobacterium TaxID=257496 RepID=UPI001052797B|nr:MULTISPECIES: PH domain-containing protein [unclassified Curtobacterium]TCL78001.1 PH (Pleckstrin Homology) domain-containing protein [Curtobacterium sp. PhB128]TCL94726.1 PH (Pleckstrin Homology) domain-containing protein [Curtobacterium sp. PhB138]